MIKVVFLTITTLLIAIQAIVKKAYNEKMNSRAPYTFCTVSVLSAAFFFLVSSGFKLDFKAELIPYALAFSIGYGAAVIGIFLAIVNGSLSLTSLVTSYSLIFPTFFGIFFYNEELSFPFIIGLVLLLISLFLINSKKGDGKITFA